MRTPSIFSIFSAPVIMRDLYIVSIVCSAAAAATVRRILSKRICRDTQPTVSRASIVGVYLDIVPVRVAAPLEFRLHRVRG